MPRRAQLALAVSLLFAACDAPDPSAPAPAADGAPAAAVVAGDGNILDAMNVALTAEGAEVRVAKAELLFHPDGFADGAAAQEIFAKNVGNKQLAHHFVPGDPRRDGRTSLTYAVDFTDGATASGLTAAQTTAAIGRAMDTWASQSCSTLDIAGSLYGLDLGYAEWALGFGGVQGWAADLTHAGWLPNSFFLALDPVGGSNIIGVTLTFTWIDGAGNSTDIDNDGKADVAFREIYYNNRFFWDVDVDFPFVDVETIALHEAGHGLSQGHFGTVAVHHKQGVKIQPEAVMNAIYFGQKQSLLGTDKGGHCSIWAKWPN